jgi:hypothetical protein
MAIYIRVLDWLKGRRWAGSTKSTCLGWSAQDFGAEKVQELLEGGP